MVDPSWYFDSGATNHITNDLTNLSLKYEFTGGERLTVGNGQGLPIKHIGHSFLPSHPKNLHLINILHCPKITKNLLNNVAQLTSANNFFLLNFIAFVVLSVIFCV